MPFTPMDMGYKLVAERHAAFVKDHPNGAIITQLAHASPTLVVVKAEIWKSRETMDLGKLPDGTGLASQPIPGVTRFTVNSEVENAETSAIGRGLAAIGYHAKDTMASDDEIAMKREDAPARVEIERSDTDKIDAAERAKIMNWGKKVLGSRDAVLEYLAKEFDIKSGKDITVGQARDIKTMFGVMAATGSAPAGVEYD